MDVSEWRFCPRYLVASRLALRNGFSPLVVGVGEMSVDGVGDVMAVVADDGDRVTGMLLVALPLVVLLEEWLTWLLLLFLCAENGEHDSETTQRFNKQNACFVPLRRKSKRLSYFFTVKH